MQPLVTRRKAIIVSTLGAARLPPPQRCPWSEHLRKDHYKRRHRPLQPSTPMNGGDNSVIGGMISAVSLVGTNWVVGLLTYKSKRLEKLLEGRPELIHNGKLFEKALQHTKITHHELMTALGAGGGATVDNVHTAMLETDGTISVIPKTK